MNVNLGESGKLVLASARRITAELSHTMVEPDHLFLGVGDLEDLAIRRALLEAGLDIDEACVRLRGRLRRGTGTTPRELPLSFGAEQVLEKAAEEAVLLGQREIEAQHILLALLAKGGGVVGPTLQDLGVDASATRQALTGMVESGQSTPSEFYKTRRNIEQAGLGATAELLDSLGRDLTLAAQEGKLSPIIGRERETDELVKVLLGKRKNNAVLIGEAGVGKTAIVEGLAQKIVAHDVPQLDGMRIRTIEVGSLVAGTIYRGQFEQRLKDLIDGIRGRDDIILFIDEMHMLVGAGEAGLSGSVDAANMLKPVLSEGTLKVLGATTIDEYRKYLEADKALMRRFQTIVVGEPAREDAVTILRGLRPKYEQFHVVKIADQALEAAVDLSVRYIQDRYLPDKALDLLDRACTERKLEEGAAAEGDGEAPVVVAEDIAEVVSVMLEIPIARLTEDEKIRLAGMPDDLKQRVIGQDHAVEAVSRAIIRARTGFGSPERPYGVFLFLGPSGVGKTKLAEEVAAFLFGDKEELVNLDMSHYIDPFSASELVGNRTGVVGWEEGGKLTNAVRKKPYSVVLLDEFEKAHPGVWNLFLPIFDNGRMTDTLGRVIDFRNTVMIMTTNVGSRRFQARTRIGFAAGDTEEAEGKVSFKDVEDEVLEDLKDTFSGEFLNRIDEVIIFNALTKDAIRQIVRQRIDETVPVELDVTEEALEFLVNESYDPAMGARPVRRAIQRQVANPLSLMAARNEIAEGDTVQVALRDGQLTFEKATPTASQVSPTAEERG
ncbi:MAG TPA: ATP-dependent Clp protease ATP-binding subunit [Actinomycetota bacterium]|nr:ATP-dependent Clp protease ATP-binding subunit [Actinomycetota bacterium]